MASPHMRIVATLTQQSKEESKDQESIQSSATPDPEHHIGKVTKSHTHESKVVSSLAPGDNQTRQ